MPRRRDKRARIVEAAFGLAAERGWRDLSLADVADAAKMPLAELYAECRSKAAIVAAFSATIDAAVLAEPASFAAEDSARDRLFDVLMRRFDAMRPYRDGLAAVLRDSAGRPAAQLCMSRRLMTSMAWMLEAAEIGTGGLAGRLRVKGAAAVYLAVLPVWLRDTSEDQSRTMAALDRRLAGAERVASLLWRGRRSEEGAPPEASPPAAGPSGSPGPRAGPAPAS